MGWVMDGLLVCALVLFALGDVLVVIGIIEYFRKRGSDGNRGQSGASGGDDTFDNGHLRSGRERAWVVRADPTVLQDQAAVKRIIPPYEKGRREANPPRQSLKRKW